MEPKLRRAGQRPLTPLLASGWRLAPRASTAAQSRYGRGTAALKMQTDAISVRQVTLHLSALVALLAWLAVQVYFRPAHNVTGPR